jgi:outer membrane protein assembly factor BamB
LLDPAKMRQQPDARLDTLAAAVDDMGAPFGEVVAGVGYDYDQWLHVYGIDGALLAFTKNNARMTVLGPEDLEPTWSLTPSSKRIAWDASGGRLLVLDLSAKDRTRASAYDVADGDRVWCAQLDQEQKDGQPVATTFLSRGDVVTALPGGDGRVVLTRLSATTGKERWSRSYADIGRADYLGPLTGDLLVAGGTEEFRLADQQPKGAGGPVISAIDDTDGRTVWTWRAAEDSAVHVVGVDDGRVIVVERSTDGVRLLALSEDGQELWSTTSADLAFESALRGGVVLTKSRAALYGYDARTGKLLWDHAVPTDRTYFPYGFTLGQMPSLDDHHVLLPTTTALAVLDVRDGSQVDHPLPVDGVSTTYWPYQLLATPDLLGVVTNTGAVLARRSPM